MTQTFGKETYCYIGKRIAERRKDWHISEGALADTIGLTIGEIRDYEAGQAVIPITILYEIAHHLQMPVMWFLPDEAALAENTPQDHP